MPRILRVLEYEGDAEWLKASLDHRAVKGEHYLSRGRVIREAILGSIPVLLLETDPNLPVDEILKEGGETEEE